MSIKVSVIVPNYNHERYLKQRIESILNQTFHDYEIILMDDCSTDNSISIIKSYQHHPAITVVINEVNSGSTFKQWNKGVSLAKGNYIWIAESDDYADERFLETLVKKLDTNPAVGLAYCQSWKVNEQGEVIDDMVSWTNDLDMAHWYSDYVEEGREELSRYLIFKNTIPNASAVLFRKAIYEQAGYADTSLKICGDYLCWVNMLHISDIMYSAKHLNYFRTHTNNVRSKFSKTGQWLLEESSILSQIYSKTQSQLFEPALKKFTEYWLFCFFRAGLSLQIHYTVYKNLSASKKGNLVQQEMLRRILRIFTPRTFSDFKILLGDYLFPSIYKKLTRVEK